MRVILLQKIVVSLLLVLLFIPALQADIIIRTFHDKNNDGIFQTASESLITGLAVAGYDEYGNFYPFLNDGKGTFTLPALLIPGRLRIQVTGYDQNQRQGIAGPSSVFMAENGETIWVPVSTGPLPDPLESGVLIPCYEKGASILKKDSPGFVSFPYSAQGVAAEYGGSGPNPRVDASISQIGSTWGVAYQTSRKRAFAATIMKRHVGLGPEGPGGIYIMDYTNGSAQVSRINLQDVTPAIGPVIDLGTVRREIVDVEIDETMPYALSTVENRIRRASYDLDAFDKVGKISYGDIEMSEDDQYMWIVNLKQRSLIKMDVSAEQVSASGALLEHYLIDDLPGLPNLNFLYRRCINAGGNSNSNGSESFTDANRVPWDKNKYSIGGGASYLNFNVANTMNLIGKTTEKGLYQTFRSGSFSYQIPIHVEETYAITLHFAEPNNYVAGDRLFDIMAEGSLIEENFDIVAHAGGNKKATTLTFQVEATGNTLDLQFTAKQGAKINQALVAGIEIAGQSIMESGVLRPWGLSFHQNSGYLGLVSDASISQSREHLNAYVLSFDPLNMSAGFKEEVAFPLSYPRERASNAHISKPQPLRTASWNAWADDWESTQIPTIGEQLSIQGAVLCGYAQPVVSGINFTDDGSMVIGIMDRWAHQVGHNNYSAQISDRTLITGYASGDIVKAFKEPNGLYVLEKTNQDDGIYYRKDDGPSYAGEFFYEENFVHPQAHHGELITGGMSILKGTNEVIATVHNPIVTNNPYFTLNGIFTQGIHFYNTEIGSKERAYLFVDQFILGKANGLGDIEFVFDIQGGEVGNLVWCDANGNGIWDPTEFGIDGVAVRLLDKENALAEVATVNTSNGGEYIFTDLLPFHCYEIRIDLQELIAMGFSGGVSPLQAVVDTTIDSNGDPSMVPGYVVSMFCTDGAGGNRHDIDFGFLGPQADDCLLVNCEDPTSGLTTFVYADITACVDPTGMNEVMLFQDSIAADSMIISRKFPVGANIVIPMDSMIWARVNITGDVMCFSLSKVTLQEITAAGELIQFNTMLCAPPFNAVSFIMAEGYIGNGMFATSPDFMMDMVADPNNIPVTLPDTIWFKDTLVGGSGCGVMGLIVIDPIPPSMVEAGDSMTICGLECVDLTTIGSIFDPNGSGAIDATWSSSGTGIFVDDNSFAGARLYCPDSMDMFNGEVILTLTVNDDPCMGLISDQVVISIESFLPRIIPVPVDTVDCLHPFAVDQAANDTFPGCEMIVNCDETLVGEVVDYQLILGDCENIVKLIKRTWRFRYDKEDYFCMDTIAIRALPANIVCPPQKDSVYCHTGYLVDENGHPSPLETGVPLADTIPLWPQPNTVCDILITYKDWEFNGDCPQTIHRKWFIKNTCLGTFDTCDQWIMIFDTIGPTLEKDLSKAVLDSLLFPDLGKPVILVPTGTHDCEAHTYVPSVIATDTCSDVKMVKAMIPGVGTVLLEYNAAEGKWESHKSIKVPKNDFPTPIYYEGYDNCHNVTLDTCYLFVKDFIKPVTICDKGVNVTVTDTTVWVPAEVFDEGSWDNCGVSLLLARRADWATACGVNLCDSLQLECYSEHHDSLWCAVLESDKHVNPIEAHYAKAMQWLCEDGSDCAGLILAGWWYDLVKYGTIDCIDHPYEVDENYLRELFLNPDLICPDDQGSLLEYVCEKVGAKYINSIPDFPAPLYSASIQTQFDVAAQIGGGWSKEVPFCCEDACQEVTVEILAMDYWCNWSKCWTTVRVEDKTPPEVVCDLFDVTMTCNAYKTYYEDAVNQALNGEFEDLQSVLGTYDKVQYDQYGSVPEKTPWTLYELNCDSNLVTKDSLIYDEHFGYIWKTYSYYRAEYDTFTFNRFNGQVADNCGLVCIEEKPWVNLDHCGNGHIVRTFKFVGQCTTNGSGHVADTIVRHQKIWITNDCEITKAMFEVPKDTIIYDCGIQYAQDGSGHVAGAADPALIGSARYVFDNDCRLVGIGYYDKVFRIVGGTGGCYKIVRTWCFADWCYIGEEPIGQGWWLDNKYEGKLIKCTQKIILRDDTPPTCTILEEIPDVVDAAGCYYSLNTSVAVADICGVLEYKWQLLNTKTNEVVASDAGALDSRVVAAFAINVKDLSVGFYKLKVIITDDCLNESICEKEFVVDANKKPTPICISSLTAELTPMDLNNDGVIDTAMAEIWASEFNRSSIAACGSSNSSLSFRIDDGTGEPALPSFSGNKLDLGCADIGDHQVRMYVLDINGNWDYCEVTLRVQNNMGGCEVTSTTGLGEVEGMISSVQDQQIEVPSNQINNTIETVSRDYGAGQSDIFVLHQNRPNPFRTKTYIAFEVPEATITNLSIHDISGRLVKTYRGHVTKGYHEWEVDRSETPASGVLYYKLETKNNTAVRKMILMD